MQPTDSELKTVERMTIYFIKAIPHCQREICERRKM